MCRCVWYQDSAQQPHGQNSQAAATKNVLVQYFDSQQVFSAGPEEVLKSHVKRDEISNQYFCGICRQFSNKGGANVRNHIEAVHFPNTFTYSC